MKPPDCLKPPISKRRNGLPQRGLSRGQPLTSFYRGRLRLTLSSRPIKREWMSKKTDFVDFFSDVIGFANFVLE